jgi:hypothetical protein
MRGWTLAIVGVSASCVSGIVGLAQGAPQPPVHAPDGGVRKTLISIAVPTLTGSPFTATVETEWTTLLPDGTTATIKNRRTIARDSSGRVFEERRMLTPDGDKGSILQALQYRDPNRHEYTNCNVRQNVCYVSRYFGAALTKMPATQHSQLFPNVKDEPLGDKNEDDLELVGTREITTITQGAIGNSKPEPIVKEFWYSPLLGVNVVTKRFDPRSGSENFLVTNISRNEPGAELFEPPQSFRIVRQDTGGLGGGSNP